MKVINVELTVKPGMQSDYEAFIDNSFRDRAVKLAILVITITNKLAVTTSTKSLNIGKMLKPLNFTITLPTFKRFLPELATS